MGGFEDGAVRAEFGLDESLTPVVVLAVGRRDATADLPGPLAARESAPRVRRPGRRPAAARAGRRSAGRRLPAGSLVPGGRRPVRAAPRECSGGGRLTFGLRGQQQVGDPGA